MLLDCYFQGKKHRTMFAECSHGNWKWDTGIESLHHSPDTPCKHSHFGAQNGAIWKL